MEAVKVESYVGTVQIRWVSKLEAEVKGNSKKVKANEYPY